MGMLALSFRCFVLWLHRSQLTIIYVFPTPPRTARHGTARHGTAWHWHGTLQMTIVTTRLLRLPTADSNRVKPSTRHELEMGGAKYPADAAVGEKVPFSAAQIESLAPSQRQLFHAASSTSRPNWLLSRQRTTPTYTAIPRINASCHALRRAPTKLMRVSRSAVSTGARSPHAAARDRRLVPLPSFVPTTSLHFCNIKDHANGACIGARSWSWR